MKIALGISKFQANLLFFFFSFTEKQNRIERLDTISLRRPKIEKKHSIRGGNGSGKKPCKKLRKMVAAHRRPWISFYRPLPVPSTLLECTSIFVRCSPSKICARLKARRLFSIRGREKKKKIILDEFHLHLSRIRNGNDNRQQTKSWILIFPPFLRRKSKIFFPREIIFRKFQPISNGSTKKSQAKIG